MSAVVIIKTGRVLKPASIERCGRGGGRPQGLRPEPNQGLRPQPDRGLAGQVDRAGALGKARFEVCKGCAEAKQDGFGCRLHKGCCFGRWRARPESRCPLGKWE